MAYDDSVKEQVRMATDIVDLITQYVPLKRMGRNFKACCPFHQEKTPSFMVHPEKQIFRCFGCGAGGDVFAFLIRHENMNFPEALRMLADRANIRLPEVSRHESKEKTGETEQLYEICREAAEYYHQLFFHPAKGAKAREYFYKRGYDESVAREFMLGWSEEDWKGLFEHLSRKRFSEPLMLKSGLVHRSPKGNLYDAFRGRLLFPIRNLQGKIVAFGGRILGPEKEGPKYLNSPETPVFRKRRELFGLYLAKKFIPENRRQLLITEGYFDFLRVFQQGFRHVVATLGTSLTEEHVQLVRRFADEAVVIYDGDKAGEAASLRGLEVFLEGDLSVKLVRMPEGLDPDDFLTKHGNDAFQKLIDHAQDFFDYKTEILFEKHDRWDNLGLIRITQELLETLSKVKNPVLLDRYLSRMASNLRVETASLREQLAKMRTRSRDAAPAAPEMSAQKKALKPSEFQEEILLLSLMMDDREICDSAANEISADIFQEEEIRRLFERIYLVRQSGGPKNWPEWLDLIPHEALKEKIISVLDFEWSSEDKKKAYRDCRDQMKKKNRLRRLEDLRRKIMDAERAGDPEGMRAWTQEYQKLIRDPVG